MKTITVLSLLMLCLATKVVAQDTTSFRLLGISSNASLDFFKNDSTYLTSNENISNMAGGNGHVIFQDPNSGKVWVLISDVNANGGNQGDRNLYEIDPTSGAYTMVADLTNEYYASGDIASDGSIYLIGGNGNSGAIAGQIWRYNPQDSSELLVGQSAVTNSRAVEYNPNNNSLYIYEGYDPNVLYIFDLTTNTETVSSYGPLLVDDEMHGAYYDATSNTMLLSAYGGEMYVSDTSLVSFTQYDESLNNIMDLSVIKLLTNDENTGFCPGDSLVLSCIWDSTAYEWYVDGQIIPFGNAQSITVNTPGTYRCLVTMNFTLTPTYMWSEEINVSAYTLPSVSISIQNGDSLWCPGDTIALQGANGGSLQWYLNGQEISGANASSLNVTAPGIYTQSKTNLSGCVAFAPSDIVISEDIDCVNGISAVETNQFFVYPNPSADDLTFDGVSPNSEFKLFDVSGNLIASSTLTNGSMNISYLKAGSYLLQIGSNRVRFVKL
jgi:hypothetical protein